MGRQRNKGLALVYAAVATAVLMAFTSLAVDYGRAQCAKTELRNAVDAAARYAATGLADSTYLAKAQSAASQNLVDGTALVLQSGDVVAGTWSSTNNTFTAGGSSPNAVRITGYRTAARGTAIPTVFARVIGRNQVDISASSTAMRASSGSSYQFVGLNGVNMGGTAQVNADTGETATASIASNSNYNLNTGTVNGNLYYRNSAPNGTVTGSKIAMTSNLAYSQPTTPAGTQWMGNQTITGNWPIAAGNYSASDVNMSNCTVTVTGVVRVYIAGNFSANSGTNIQLANSSSKLYIYITQSAGFNYNSTYPLKAAVYCPTSPANVNAGSICGSLVASQISLSGNAQLRYNSNYAIDPAYETNPSSGGGGSGGSISMVR